MQAVACTHCVRTLNGLRSIFSDVHAAGKNGFDFFLSAELTELCEARGATRANGKDGGSLRVSVFGLWGWVRTVWVCFSLFKKELRDRLTNVLVSGTIGMRNGGFAIAPYLCRYYFTIACSQSSLNVPVTPYLPRYHPNKKAKLNTSFAFCFLCFCYQNFFFLHSHKLRMTKSTLTPMTAG